MGWSEVGWVTLSGVKCGGSRWDGFGCGGAVRAGIAWDGAWSRTVVHGWMEVASGSVGGESTGPISKTRSKSAEIAICL